MKSSEFMNSDCLSELTLFAIGLKPMVDKNVLPMRTWIELIENSFIDKEKVLLESSNLVEILGNIVQHCGNSADAIIGNEYIPVYIHCYKDTVMCYDCFNNYPPKVEPEFQKLIDIVNVGSYDEYHFETSTGMILKYPNKYMTQLTTTFVSLCPTAELYNQLALALRLQFDATLLMFKSHCDSPDVNEDIGRRGFLGGLLGTATLSSTKSTQTQPQTQPTPQPQTQPKVQTTKTKLPQTPQEHKQFVTMHAEKYGKLSGVELKQFVSRCAHETLNFMTLIERRSDDSCNKKYGPEYRNVKGNKSKVLGNTVQGDGVRYKGRGYLQITGRYNYIMVGKGINQDLVNNPRLLENPIIALKASLYFWNHRVKPKVTDFSNVKQVTKNINPGLKGLQDRIKKFNKRN